MYSIRFDELTVDFDGHFKLHGINWALGSNEHWAITGPNGSGKSALASVIAGEGQRERGLLTGVPKHVAIVSFEAQAALIESERKKDDADILDVVSEGTPVQEILDEDCADKGLQARLVSAMNIEYLLERSFRKALLGRNSQGPAYPGDHKRTRSAYSRRTLRRVGCSIVRVLDRVSR